MATPTELILQHTKLPFKGSLHPYQVEDINRLAPAESCGLYLDLGLGKTVVSILIGIYKLLTGDFNTVIVMCPEGLITQWVEVIKKTDADVIDYRGTPRAREKMSLDVDFLVMSYQIFQKDYDRLKDLKAYFIVDEATILGNSQNLLWKMLMGGETRKVTPVPGKMKPEIVTNRYNKIQRGMALLTGTPVNRPEDAYGLIRITAPEIYRNYEQFKRIHVASENQYEKPDSYQNLELLQKNLLVNAVLRCSTDYLQLPPIIFKTIVYDLAPDHLELYRELVKTKMVEFEGRMTIDALSASGIYHWAQRIVLCPESAGYKKTPVGIEIMDSLLAGQNKFLIFCKYVDSNKKIKERYNIGAFYGGTTSREQDAHIKDFKEGSLRGMTLHPKSGGFGLDLPEAKYINFGELPNTPREFRQCCGRAYRQGLNHPLVVSIMWAKGTIQESIARKILDTDDLMAEVVETKRSMRTDLFANMVTATAKTKKEVLDELSGKAV